MLNKNDEDITFRDIPFPVNRHDMYVYWVHVTYNVFVHDRQITFRLGLRNCEQL